MGSIPSTRLVFVKLLKQRAVIGADIDQQIIRLSG